ncbi:MAG: murein transglycosylase [Rhodospirillaceae bacterium]|nr:murein transglycosylase [Magnetovibrio sp.]MAY67010.1 murein transglycosylase [Rhodospirillaceae bacterium]
MFCLTAGAQAASKAGAAPIPARDLTIMTKAFKAMDQGKWSQVKSLEAKARTPLARKLIQWGRLSSYSGPAEFDELSAFLYSNPQWPRSGRMTAKAEARLSATGTDEQVLSWFTGRRPITALGKARYAVALLNRGYKKDETRATAMLRDAWINGNFSKADEKHFMGRHGKRLRTSEHIARLDRLLWEGRYWAVRRHLWRVPKAYQKLGLARISLRRQMGNVDALVKQVPAKLQRDPGLIYERLRWRRKKNKDTALDLVRYLPGDQPHPELWWEERSTLVRRALRKGFITDAYRIARNHGLSEGADYAEAEWLAGWVALRFLSEPKVALQHFQRMYARVNYPISLSRGAYWIARSYDDLKQPRRAADWFARAARHPTTYYGQLSLARVDPAAVLRLPPDPEPDPELVRQFQSHELTRAFRALAAAGADDMLRSVLDTLLDRAYEHPGWRVMTADLAAEAERRDLAVRVAKQSLRDGLMLASHGYPAITLPRLPKKWNLPTVEAALVLGMIRQESAFRGSAVSRASAQGLMQLMPATAKVVAKRQGLPFSRGRLITDARYNLTLGQTYLAGLITEFDGSYVLSVAGYNAGPHRVRRWLKEYGDPRQKDVDVIDWVEMIPFDETRDYVQRVMENLHVYRSRLSGTEVAFAPHVDLAR